MHKHYSAKPSKHIHFEIYNSTGVIVFTGSTTIELNTLDLSNLSNGLYFIAIIYDKKKVITQRIVKTD